MLIFMFSKYFDDEYLELKKTSCIRFSFQLLENQPKKLN